MKQIIVFAFRVRVVCILGERQWTVQEYGVQMVKDVVKSRYVLQHILSVEYVLMDGTYQQKMNLKNCSLRSVDQMSREQNLNLGIAGIIVEMEQMITVFLPLLMMVAMAIGQIFGAPQRKEHGMYTL